MLYPRPDYPVPPSDDDFDERLDGQREAERSDGVGAVEGVVASLSPEETDRG